MDTKRIGVLSVGNILMGDDGIGPYILKILESRYEFPANVVLDDLGTPGLGITSFFSDYDAIILIDAVRAAGPPGTLKLYRKDQLVQLRFQPRLSPHDPALVEALLFAELSGVCPKEVLLVGVIPQSCELGCSMTSAMLDAIEPALTAILFELYRFHVVPKLRSSPIAPSLWWQDNLSSESDEGVSTHVLGDPR